MISVYDVIVVGAGPAGLSAGIYTSRAGLSTLILEKESIGGELMDREMIENYPGYPEGIMGPDLGSKMRTQAMNYGAEIKLGEAIDVENDEDYKFIKTPEDEYSSRAIIFTGGAHPKKLGIPGEEEFTEKGVFYCATCDGPKYANKAVAVAGGGDSGLTEAIQLLRLGAKVTLIEFLPRLSASKVLQDRAMTNAEFKYTCGTKIESIQGNVSVKSITVVNVETGEKSHLEVEGLLIRIGLEANTGYLKNIIPLDERGQIEVNEKMETQIPGIFAAGDIRHNSPMQISTAVGDGVTASISVSRYLGIR